MAHYPDLSPYDYIVTRWTVQPDALNVGWLEYPHPFERGPHTEDTLSRLRELCLRPVNLCRGSHTCNFCHKAQGNGEIRVIGEEAIYAAPVLIAHYVEAHGYKPPDSFIKALLQTKG